MPLDRLRVPHNRTVQSHRCLYREWVRWRQEQAQVQVQARTEARARALVQQYELPPRAQQAVEAEAEAAAMNTSNESRGSIDERGYLQGELRSPARAPVQVQPPSSEVVVAGEAVAGEVQPLQ